MHVEIVHILVQVYSIHRQLTSMDTMEKVSQQRPMSDFHALC